MPDVYIEKSPLLRMHTMKTPTLIMFGTRDTNVPTEQGWEHFRAMQQSGAAPVRFPDQALAQEEEDERGARLDRPLPAR